MKPETVCLFPGTRPKDEVLFPLVQLFAEAVYLAPIENDTPPLPPLAQQLLAQGLLRFHCPAPLSADRERFLCLLSELRQRPDEYAALALSGTGSEAAESKQAIVNALLRQDRGAEQARQQQEQLWQTRLVLKLAEIAEQEDEEIEHSLRRIALREQDILHALQDERVEAFVSPEASAASMSGRTHLRLKAWLNLLALGSQPLSVSVLVAADREAFALLMEQSGSGTQILLEAPLPAAAADSDWAGKRAAFRQDAAALLSDWPRSFESTAWESVLERHYPAARHGRCRLSLHSSGRSTIAQAAAVGLLHP